MASKAAVDRMFGDFSNHTEARHAFDLDDNERSRAIIRRTIDFLKAHNQ